MSVGRRRSHRAGRGRARLTGAVAVLAFALVAAALAVATGGGAIAEARRAPSFTATIAYAVDGDTLRIEESDGELQYVRLLGIDTPEDVKDDYPTECGAKAAARSMEALAPEGATVRLVYDGELEDNYGRILAHAYVNGRQLELAQLKRGWAYVYRYHGRTFAGLARYYAAADRARSEGLGVWGQCGGDFHSARPGVQN
jgi:micrococcal nuclease